MSIRYDRVAKEYSAGVNVHIRFGMNRHDANGLLATGWCQRESHSEVEVFVVIPFVDLRLVIDELSRRAGLLPWPTWILSYTTTD